MADATTQLYEEMKILVPGPFVVLQGSTGDGLSNTIDGSLPVLPRRRRPRQQATVAGSELASNEADAMTIDPQSTSPSSGEEDVQHVPQRTAGGIVVNGPRYAVTAGMVAAAAAAENNRRVENRNSSGNGSSDDFIVVTDDDNNGQQLAEEDLKAIKDWKMLKRETELQQWNDWEDSLYQVPPEIKMNHSMMTRSPATNPNNDPQSNSWWQRNGEIAVLRELPTKLFDGSVTVSRIGTLPPGLTVDAKELVELNSTTLLPIQGARGRSQNANSTAISGEQQRSYHQGRVGVIQMIKVETREGRMGYSCLSLDGFPLLAPGLPDAYINPGAPNCVGGHPSGTWLWRVTCPSGAFVRQGLDLRTRHIRTLPYGSLVRVTRRCINDQGLSRLRTSGWLTDTLSPPSDSSSIDESRVPVDGWCSELLNPLSGQRGIVVQPLPFPVPAIYRVTLTMG